MNYYLLLKNRRKLLSQKILEKNILKIHRTFFERRERKRKKKERKERKQKSNKTKFQIFYYIAQNIHLERIQKRIGERLREIYSKTTREIVLSRGKNGRNRRE